MQNEDIECFTRGGKKVDLGADKQLRLAVRLRRVQNKLSCSALPRYSGSALTCPPGRTSAWSPPVYSRLSRAGASPNCDGRSSRRLPTCLDLVCQGRRAPWSRTACGWWGIAVVQFTQEAGAEMLLLVSFSCFCVFESYSAYSTWQHRWIYPLWTAVTAWACRGNDRCTETAGWSRPPLRFWDDKKQRRKEWSSERLKKKQLSSWTKCWELFTLKLNVHSMLLQLLSRRLCVLPYSCGDVVPAWGILTKCPDTPFQLRQTQTTESIHIGVVMSVMWAARQMGIHRDQTESKAPKKYEVFTQYQHYIIQRNIQYV